MTSGSPWFRATDVPEGEPRPQEPGDVPPGAGYPAGPLPPAYEAGTGAYAPIPGPEGYQAPQHPQPPQEAYQGAYTGPYATPAPAGGYEQPAQAAQAAYEAPAAPAAPATPATPAQAPYEPQPAPAPRPSSGRRATARPVHDTPVYGTPVFEEPEPAPGTAAPAPDGGTPPLPGPGRAERRRAARRKGRGTPEPAAAAPRGPAAPLSRVEARRAARAAKDSVGVVLSRAVGELFITFGVVMLLFVTYQLWWTNVRAGQQTDKAKEQIENSWSQGAGGDGTPDAFEPGQGFAIMYIPKLDVVAPIAEGISKTKVLDKGLVGHYGEGKLKTAMPGDKQGNFAVAGHRNTHGEPFRYINQLKPGDPIVVETRDAYYTYAMASILPQTSPSNVSVIEPVPKGSGFTGPGRYITLTTCTPEFTSTYRMIVWGKLVDERPRSKGKPPALVG
ncbi:class E sortase [Streptomyces sp. NPDC048659]|uniref:class E sortase n=1 Tax=Streptomyces sp. NPDC048659 TaxID=3155489 RepID=UPI003445D534